MINPLGDNVFQVECEYCHVVEEYDVEAWDELMEEMKVDKWKNIHTGDQWMHKCWECQS